MKNCCMQPHPSVAACGCQPGNVRAFQALQTHAQAGRIASIAAERRNAAASRSRRRSFGDLRSPLWHAGVPRSLRGPGETGENSTHVLRDRACTGRPERPNRAASSGHHYPNALLNRGDIRAQGGSSASEPYPATGALTRFSRSTEPQRGIGSVGNRTAGCLLRGSRRTSAASSDPRLIG